MTAGGRVIAVPTGRVRARWWSAAAAVAVAAGASIGGGALLHSASDRVFDHGTSNRSTQVLTEVSRAATAVGAAALAASENTNEPTGPMITGR